MDDIELIDEIVKRADEHQKQKEKAFAIAELEKIKAEMEKMVFTVGGYEFIDIIDEHISELKGENNEH